MSCDRIEGCFAGASTYELFTGSKSEANIRLYERHGYTITRTSALAKGVHHPSRKASEPCRLRPRPAPNNTTIGR